MLSSVCLSVEFGNWRGMPNDLKSFRSTPVGVFSLVIMSDGFGILGGMLFS